VISAKASGAKALESADEFLTERWLGVQATHDFFGAFP
jgi:hypothetical protein